MRVYNERRNKLIWIRVERRKIPQKEAARKLGITWANLRVILYRMRHVTKCNNEAIDRKQNVS